jgi:hypothetical protein
LEVGGRVLVQINEAISTEPDTNEIGSKLLGIASVAAVGAVGGAISGGLGASSTIASASLNSNFASKDTKPKFDYIKQNTSISQAALGGAL